MSVLMGGKSLPEVLVVEDNPVAMKAISEMLLALGISSDSASSGCEALNLVQGRRYDVILMDIRLPGMNGIAATRKIRKLEAVCGEHNSRIFAVTECSLEEVREECFFAAMNDVISKPVTTEKLKDLFARL